MINPNLVYNSSNGGACLPGIRSFVTSLRQIRQQHGIPGNDTAEKREDREAHISVKSLIANLFLCSAINVVKLFL